MKRKLTPKSRRKWHAKPALKNLARAWIEFHADPTAGEMFYRQLDAFVRGWSPSMRGLQIDDHLVGEIRQDAVLLLFRRHLKGNRLLAGAMSAKSAPRVERALLQCIKSTLRIVVARHLSEVARRNNVERELSEERAALPVSREPINRQEIALAFLLRALSQKRVDRIDGEILRLQLEEGLSQSVAGERLAMSRHAACWREARAVRILRKMVEQARKDQPDNSQFSSEIDE